MNRPRTGNSASLTLKATTSHHVPWHIVPADDQDNARLIVSRIVGTGLFRNGELMPHVELAHHPVHGRKDYNGYLGKKALEKIGKKKWNGRVQRVFEILHYLIQPDMVYIGGGNSRNITFKLDTHIKLISNEDGILGGSMAREMSPGTPTKPVPGDGDAMP